MSPRARKKSKDQSPAEQDTVAPQTPSSDEAEALSVFEKQRAREQAVQPDLTDGEAMRRLEASRTRKTEIEPERPMPEPEAPAGENDVGGKPAVGTHTERVLAGRPKMQPVAAGYRDGPVFPPAGIRVNKGVDRQLGTLGAAAIQFSDERPLSRATEYELMTMLQDAGFQYKEHSRQWVKPYVKGAGLGDNVIEATRLAEKISAVRNEGLGR